MDNLQQLGGSSHGSGDGSVVLFALDASLALNRHIEARQLDALDEAISNGLLESVGRGVAKTKMPIVERVGLVGVYSDLVVVVTVVMVIVVMVIVVMVIDDIIGVIIDVGNGVISLVGSDNDDFLAVLAYGASVVFEDNHRLVLF